MVMLLLISTGEIHRNEASRAFYPQCALMPFQWLALDSGWVQAKNGS
jgi:hypothetical protein